MNVKSGDMAILVKSTYGTNLGSICTVEEYVGTVEFPDMVLHEVWRVEFANPIEVELLGSDGKFYKFKQKKALVCDSWLIPITGITDDEHTEDDIIVEKELEDVST